MNNNAPWPKLVMAIHMPQCVWLSRFILTPLDGPIVDYHLCNVVNMTQGCHNLRVLNPNSLLKKESTDVMNTCIQVRVPELLDHQIKL